jgi:hypothetical protein
MDTEAAALSKLRAVDATRSKNTTLWRIAGGHHNATRDRDNA